MEISSAAIIPIVLGLGEVLKQIGVPKKFMPLCSLALGVLLSFVIGSETLAEAIVRGLIYGLSASGLYSGVKNVKEGIES